MAGARDRCGIIDGGACVHGGPKPIAYTPFGELTVFVFFGLVAVVGTEWVLTGRVGARISPSVRRPPARTSPLLLDVAMSMRVRAISPLLPLLLFPTAVRLLRDFVRCPPGAAFNEILFRTFRLEFRFAVLLSAGLLLAQLKTG